MATSIIPPLNTEGLASQMNADTDDEFEEIESQEVDQDDYLQDFPDDTEVRTMLLKYLRHS